ncbi:MAG: hypothetical protein II161_00800 [Erysipelotrichaceae bacterium]|nr:hypothetical protein [Erysipelotrichaceae bacterium]MBQ4252066.1 hypothetical protein [Erysipelotrichaceae bacterium]
MKYETKGYFLEIPDNLTGVMGCKGRDKDVRVLMLTEEDCSGLLASLKLYKKGPRNRDNTEKVGTLTDPEGTIWQLYAVYGEEGSCSEENEDLYWRLVDRLWLVFESIRPQEGYHWERNHG